MALREFTLSKYSKAGLSGLGSSPEPRVFIHPFIYSYNKCSSQSPVLLKLSYAYQLPVGLIYMQVLIQEGWDPVWALHF